MSKSVVLERADYSDHGTFGRLSFDGQAVFSGELPWRGNTPNLSCIPAGTYACAWTYSPAFKRMMYLVQDVPGRSGIRIHPANLMGDREKGLKSHLYGCIALGERLGTIHKQKAVLLSRPAVGDLEEWGAGEPFELEIVDGMD